MWVRMSLIHIFVNKITLVSLIAGNTFSFLPGAVCCNCGFDIRMLHLLELRKTTATRTTRCGDPLCSYHQTSGKHAYRYRPWLPSCFGDGGGF